MQLSPIQAAIQRTYPGYVSEVGLEEVCAPALNPFFAQTSSSRIQMFTSHLTQHLWFKGVEPPRICSGIEREFAKTTFSQSIPVDAQIVAVIPRYPTMFGPDAIRENPETVVIYEDLKTNRIGCITMNRHHSLHKDFGFRYVPENQELLFPKSGVKAGTRFGRSPEVDEQGNYCFGGEFNVAFLTRNEVAEDGIIISKSAAKRMTTKAFGTRVVKWGSRRYPLNIYSNDPRVYKAFPDIGEHVRPDGLLFVLRDHDPTLAPVLFTPEALMEPDQIYDKPVYAEPNAKIIDIKVWCERSGKQVTPIGMETQADKYAAATTRFYQRIIEEYDKLYKNWGANLKITGEFQALVTAAIADQGPKNQNERVQKIYRMQPLDEYRVEITYEYDLEPTIGFKVTGVSGDIRYNVTRVNGIGRII